MLTMTWREPSAFAPVSTAFDIPLITHSSATSTTTYLFALLDTTRHVPQPHLFTQRLPLIQLARIRAPEAVELEQDSCGALLGCFGLAPLLELGEALELRVEFGLWVGREAGELVEVTVFGGGWRDGHAGWGACLRAGKGER